MSWGVSAVGNSVKVVEKLKKDFDEIQHLTGIEKEIKDLAGQLVIKVASACTISAVKVVAGGGGSTLSQNLNIKIKPIYDFVE